MLTHAESRPHHHVNPCDEGCTAVGEFTRLRYFHGQPLSALDLRREQAYHTEKARLRNRLLHGWGIVCGLDISVTAEEDCRPGEGAPASTEVLVLPGSAIDCAGNEIVVRHPRPVSVSELLSRDERERLHEKPATIYLTLCFRELPCEPTRPLLANGCEPPQACEYARVVETFQICASTTPPDRGPECEPCCGTCGDPCLELAAVKDFDLAEPITEAQLDFSGRRRLALHPFAQITEINWVHDATYAIEDADRLLDEGLEVRFSRPIQVASLASGVIELTGIDRGAGRSGSIFNIEGEFVGLPDSALTDRFVFKRNTGERLNPDDRVIVTVRGDFIVDECCRAVDGNHVGGAVPVSASSPSEPQSQPARTCPARPTGDGVEGGDFVSWFYAGKRAEK